MRSKFQIMKMTINVCPLVPVVSVTKKDGSKVNYLPYLDSLD